MKKIVYFIILIIILIFAFIIGYSLKNNFKENTETLSWENAENLDLSSTLTYFDDCYNNLNVPKEQRPEELRYCAEENLPKKEDVEKLRSLNGLKTISVCHAPAQEFHETECTPKEEVSESCIEIWKTSYSILVTRPHPISISISKCEKDYYYRYSRQLIAGPPEITLSIIDINETIANNLNNPHTEFKATEQKIQMCLNSGGKWEQGQYGGYCNQKASDAGKSCTDSNQCEGSCLAPEDAIEGKHTIGICSEYKSKSDYSDIVLEGIYIKAGSAD